MANNSVVTQDKLQEFYETKVYPYLNGSANLGFTPIGTVISVMSNEAPDNYLVCDGTAYNISEYSDLANFFEDQFGSKNYFGGNGTTTFAVPDLRGEFLRGSGTNSHTNQGNGANVGVHQDGSGIPCYGMTNDGRLYYQTPADTFYQDNPDSRYNPSVGSANKGRQYSSSSGTWDTSASILFTTRPTNTSVLYCIAYKNIYISTGVGGYPVEITNPQDKQGLQFDGTNNKWVNGAGGMHEYSTAEKVVGTWIDGKPVYEKTINIGTLSSSSTENRIDVSSLNVDTRINCIVFGNNANLGCIYSSYNDTTLEKRFGTSNLVIKYKESSSRPLENTYAIITYTKTTDTV